MVPFADQINHENVTTNYDCLDPETGQTLMSAEEKAERARKEEEEKHEKTQEFLSTLKNDLESLNQKMIENGMQTSVPEDNQTPNTQNTWVITP